VLFNHSRSRFQAAQRRADAAAAEAREAVRALTRARRRHRDRLRFVVGGFVLDRITSDPSGQLARLVLFGLSPSDQLSVCEHIGAESVQQAFDLAYPSLPDHSRNDSAVSRRREDQGAAPTSGQSSPTP
jgi:hypothetical protein